MSQPEIYTAKSTLPVPAAEAFAYHERPGALSRLVPPWESVELEYSDGSLAVGSKVVMKTKIFGVPFRWVARHTEYEPPRLFADTQVTGPFAAWDHRHEFLGDGPTSTLRDSITYEVPLGPIGRLLGGGKARRTIEAMFAYRHRLTKDDLKLHADRPSEPMTVAISGSTGLVGSQLAAMLGLLGHTVRPIVRSATDNQNEIAAWSGDDEGEKFSDVDVVVHLAGKSIADSRWTDSVKQEIRDSRVIKTRQLCERLAKLDRKPKTLVCASATGIYGDRGDENLTESSAIGDDFLADVASEWEQACQPARDAGIRVVHTRFGIILSPKGGCWRNRSRRRNLPAENWAAGRSGGAGSRSMTPSARSIT